MDRTAQILLKHDQAVQSLVRGSCACQRVAATRQAAQAGPRAAVAVQLTHDNLHCCGAQGHVSKACAGAAGTQLAPERPAEGSRVAGVKRVTATWPGLSAGAPTGRREGAWRSVCADERAVSLPESTLLPSHVFLIAHRLDDEQRQRIEVACGVLHGKGGCPHQVLAMDESTHLGSIGSLAPCPFCGPGCCSSCACCNNRQITGGAGRLPGTHQSPLQRPCGSGGGAACATRVHRPSPAGCPPRCCTGWVHRMGAQDEVGAWGGCGEGSRATCTHATCNMHTCTHGSSSRHAAAEMLEGGGPVAALGAARCMHSGGAARANEATRPRHNPRHSHGSATEAPPSRPPPYDCIRGKRPDGADVGGTDLQDRTRGGGQAGSSVVYLQVRELSEQAPARRAAQRIRYGAGISR